MMAELTDDQKCSIDKLFKERLKSCQVTAKGMITGFLDSRQAYDELFRDLKVLGCRYSVRSCYGGKTDSGSLQYKTVSPDLQIPFTGSPFHVEGSTYFICTHGYRYYKSKAATDEDRSDGEGGTRKVKRRRVNESIKLGCPAKMTVKCIRIYPDYKTNSDSWRRKSDVLKRLKADMKLDPPPRYELNFWISVSPESTHTHERSATLRITPLHPDLIAEIHRLVKEGTTSIPAVKSHLSKFVEKMFKTASVHPDPSNTAFYPSDKSIYNHVHDAKTKNVDSDEKRAVGCSSEPVSVPSAVITSPPEENQLTEKCDSDLAAVPVMESTFACDWQDQTVLPTNFVQVVNSSGTIVLMVTQPLRDQLVHQVEDEVNGAQSNLDNVTLDDNIYTVITDQSEPVLHLNNDSSILMPQPCTDQNEIGQVLTISNSNQSDALRSCRTNVMDLNRVITMDGQVISASSVIDENDDVSCNGDQSQYLFGGEDSQSEILPDDVGGNKTFTALCALPQTQPPKVDTSHIFSSDSNIENQEESVNKTSKQKERKGVLKRVRKRRQTEDHIVTSREFCEADDKTRPSCQVLRDAAQDIINMSYWYPNNGLLQEMVKVFEKYRKQMRQELEAKKKDIFTKEHETKSPMLGETSSWDVSVKSYSEKICYPGKNARRLRRGPTKKKPAKSGGNIFSSSESSVENYDDLIIND